MFALGLYMVELDYYHRWYRDAPLLHKSLGILMLILLYSAISDPIRNRSLRLTLLQRISGLGVPAAKHEKDTDPPIFLMYSALGLLSNVGGSLMMT